MFTRAVRTGRCCLRKSMVARTPPSGPRLLSVADEKCRRPKNTVCATLARSNPHMLRPRHPAERGGLNHLPFITATTRRRARLFDSDRFRWAVCHALIAHIAKNAMYAPLRIALIPSVLAITAVFPDRCRIDRWCVTEIPRAVVRFRAGSNDGGTYARRRFGPLTYGLPRS
jgi:hypothetical protein